MRDGTLLVPWPPGWWGMVWKLLPGPGASPAMCGLVSLGERLGEMAALTALCTAVINTTPWPSGPHGEQRAVGSVAAAGLPAWGVEPPVGTASASSAATSGAGQGVRSRQAASRPGGASVRPGLGLSLGLDSCLPTVSSQGRPLCAPCTRRRPVSVSRVGTEGEGVGPVSWVS